MISSRFIERVGFRIAERRRMVADHNELRHHAFIEKHGGLPDPPARPEIETVMLAKRGRGRRPSPRERVGPAWDGRDVPYRCEEHRLTDCLACTVCCNVDDFRPAHFITTGHCRGLARQILLGRADGPPDAMAEASLDGDVARRCCAYDLRTRLGLDLDEATRIKIDWNPSGLHLARILWHHAEFKSDDWIVQLSDGRFALSRWLTPEEHQLAVSLAPRRACDLCSGSGSVLPAATSALALFKRESCPLCGGKGTLPGLVSVRRRERAIESSLDPLLASLPAHLFADAVDRASARMALPPLPAPDLSKDEQGRWVYHEGVGRERLTWPAPSPR